VITNDVGLTRRLESGADPERVSLRFARSGYEGSAIISTFSPALVVMDSDLSEVRNGGLPESIVNDERVPAARVVVICRSGHADLFENLPVLRIPYSFSAGELVALAEDVTGDHSSFPRDVA